MPLPMPKQVPEMGFYYNHNHDPNGPVNNHAYEVVAINFHTEEDCRPGEEHFVSYRPLYESSVYKASKALGVPCFDGRPLEMWLGKVTKGVAIIPRYQKITDPAIISQLEKIRDEMY